MEERKHDIVKDAYYLISNFLDAGKDITNLQVQKLMYFFEAYYMNVYDEKKVYDCNFCAWAFGPVAIPLYKEFKKFGNNCIELTEEERAEGNSIDNESKGLLDVIYNVFCDVPAMKLVEYTHRQDSPWTDVWERNGKKVGYGDNTYIDKEASKIWFRKTFEKKHE